MTVLLIGKGAAWSLSSGAGSPHSHLEHLRRLLPIIQVAGHPLGLMSELGNSALRGFGREKGSN